MKNRLFATLSLIFLTMASLAQEGSRTQMEEHLENGLDFLSVCIGIVLGVIAGFIISRRIKK
jgi:formate-dependent nitrite reductase membrane component NrfD